MVFSTASVMDLIHKCGSPVIFQNNQGHQSVGEFVGTAVTMQLCVLQPIHR